MSRVVILDSSPLGLLALQKGKSTEADACKKWLADLSLAGVHFYLPDIADYEVRRELLRLRRTNSIARLDRLKLQLRFLPITNTALLKAADLWATIRQAGLATASNDALDGDVILAAQALTHLPPLLNPIVATSNKAHISRFLPADIWQNITP
jgi:predicted nucleic acid-binding protein